MRELILKRIKELFKTEPPNPDTMRWQSCWFDGNFKAFGKASHKQVHQNKLTHISNLDWQTMPDDVLINMFELIVMKVYRQY